VATEAFHAARTRLLLLNRGEPDWERAAGGDPLRWRDDLDEPRTRAALFDLALGVVDEREGRFFRVEDFPTPWRVAGG
jgi:hypothetical protein